MTWPAYRIVMYDLVTGEPLTYPWVIWAGNEFDASDCYQVLYKLATLQKER